MALSKRDKRVLVFGGAVAAGILLVAYVVLPLIDVLAGVEAELDQKERALIQRVRALRSEPVLRGELAWVSDQRRRLESFLLDSREVSLAQNELETIVRSLAEQNGLVISRSTPLQGSTIGDRYAKVTLQLNLDGGMAELAAFLDALSRHPKYLVIDDFFMTTFRRRNENLIQPRINVSGYIRVPDS